MARNRWHLILLSGLCCLAPLLSSCSGVALAPKGPEAGDKARCATWAKPKGMVWMKTPEFSVLLPKGWSNVTRTENDDGDWAVFKGKKQNKSKPIDTIYVDRTKGGTDMSVAEMNVAIKNDARNALLSQMKASEFKDATPLNLDGIKAAYLTGKAKVAGVKVNMAFIGVTDRNYRYGLVVATTPGSATGKAAFMKNLECSWRWTP